MGKRQYAERDWRVLLHDDEAGDLHYGPRASRNAQYPRANFDELVLAGWLHVEQLTRHTWWLRVGERTCTIRELKDGTVRVVWDDDEKDGAR